MCLAANLLSGPFSAATGPRGSGTPGLNCWRRRDSGDLARQVLLSVGRNAEVTVRLH